MAATHRVFLYLLNVYKQKQNPEMKNLATLRKAAYDLVVRGTRLKCSRRYRVTLLVLLASWAARLHMIDHNALQGGYKDQRNGIKSVARAEDVAEVLMYRGIDRGSMGRGLQFDDHLKHKSCRVYLLRTV